MTTEPPNHPDAVCSLHGLPCHELGEVLIERDALKVKLPDAKACPACRALAAVREGRR